MNNGATGGSGSARGASDTKRFFGSDAKGCGGGSASGDGGESGCGSRDGGGSGGNSLDGVRATTKRRSNKNAQDGGKCKCYRWK